MSCSPACTFCPCEMFACHAKLKLLGLHFHSPVQKQATDPKAMGRTCHHAEQCCSPSKPLGAVGAPHLVLAVSLTPCVARMVSKATHLILARDCKGTRLSTYLGPNYQNGDAQDCKSKNEVCSKADSELHAVLVQCVFAMPLLSCRYIV